MINYYHVLSLKDANSESCTNQKILRSLFTTDLVDIVITSVTEYVV